MILESLQFVKGAVAKKDFAPILNHFGIADGKIIGYNGTMALCSPIGLDLVANPKAVPFYNAISSCGDGTQITQMPNGNLLIKCKGFKVTIECDLDPFPSIPSEGGDRLVFQDPILPALRELSPFMSEDASRPWSRGILLRGQSAFATNNVCIVQKWIGMQFQTEICIPSDIVTEMIRIGEEPSAVEIRAESITVHYPKNRWLFSTGMLGEWPNVEGILDKHSRAAKPIPETMFLSLERLKNFLPKEGTCYLRSGKITTSLSDDEGAECEVPYLDGTGKFAWKYLMLLKGTAISGDFSALPICFYGDKLRGVVSGWAQ